MRNNAERGQEKEKSRKRRATEKRGNKVLHVEGSRV
jgi:hypothetical protein